MSDSNKTVSLDSITSLRCTHPQKFATKTLTLLKDGTIEVKKSDKEQVFHFREHPVNNILDVFDILVALGKDPKQLVIRGRPLKEPGSAVHRRMHEPLSAFAVEPRHWAMLDFDKIPYPAFLNPAENPEEAVRWAIRLLPECFQNVTCIYQFSSSQNVPAKIGEPPPATLSLHLWFWCDRKIDETEWKRYLEAWPSCPVDSSLFSAVHQHYIAAPIIKGFDDPLKKRLGLLQGGSNSVCVPALSEPPKKKEQKPRPAVQPNISDDDRGKAAQLFVENYPDEGGRGDFCAALAGAMYRNGWSREDTSDFVEDVAEAGKDEEAQHRQESALRICDAIDQGRAAQGVPRLKEYIPEDVLDQAFGFLGIGPVKPETLISRLNNQSKLDEIEKVLEALISLPADKKKFYVDQIAVATGNKIAVIAAMLKQASQDALPTGSVDPALEAARELLHQHFNKGRHLIHYVDGAFWCYTGKFWKRVQDEYLVGLLVPIAEEIVGSYMGIRTLNAGPLTGVALDLLKGMVHTEDDVLRLKETPYPAINCNNGELWSKPDGSVELLPFRASSYLTQCGKVDYDPNAGCPRFIEALEEIFSKSSDPKDMVRHIGEIGGYIIQSSRDFPLFFMFIGNGQDGKTSIMKVIGWIVGEDAVFSGRIADLEQNRFTLGQLAGKRIFYDDDVDASTLLPDGTLKKISEKKLLTGELKHGNHFNFINSCIPVMLTNEPPSTRDLTWGLRRRARVVPFNRQFTDEEDKKNLFEEIWAEESSGILNFFLKGYQRFVKQGGFKEPADCVKATKAWLVKSNALSTFLEDECIFRPRKWVHVRDLYEDFEEYSKQSGFRQTMVRSTFESRLEHLGYEIGIRKGQKAVLGITTVFHVDSNCDEKHPEYIGGGCGPRSDGAFSRR